MLGVLLSLQLAATPAQAEASSGSDESVFVYGFRGLGIGVPIGLSAGYLLTRDGSWGGEDWQDLGVGVAVGAIAGAAGGIGIGLADLSDGRSGMGAIVLRDTWYGTLLGITIGAIIGGVRWMGDGNGQDMLVSMAWGAVIGAPVGIGVGFAEAAMRDELGRNDGPRVARLSGAQGAAGGALHFTVAPVATQPERGLWGLMPTLSGSF
jgi:hypothetical protein